MNLKKLTQTDKKNVSFKNILLRTFAVTSIVPIIALGIFSVVNVLSTINRNTDTLMQSNLDQIDNNIEISLEAYEDLAYQLYTNDDVVEWVRRIDRDEDVPATISQLRRLMNGLLNTKDYIRAITIVTEGGSVITYDTMTAISTDSSWIGNSSKGITTLYEEVTSDYNMHTYSTEYATTFANKDYYLFHIAHRIVDYKKLNDRLGMVIISIDEELLEKIYSPTENNAGRFTYIYDDSQKIISVEYDKSLIGKPVEEIDIHRNKDSIISKMHPQRLSGEYVHCDDTYGWTIVTIIDSSDLRNTISVQVLLVVGIAVSIMMLALGLSLRLTKRLNSEIATVASGMERAKDGDLTTRIEISDEMPEEIMSMADVYNDMITKLDEANEKEKDAIRRQQEAQIAALEAQINPHFLYNTLDTINWMAIERDEFDISNAINALATILRYAIAKSNAEVTVKDEVEWLKKYIFLQQFRLKDKFQCELDVDPDLFPASIHKLLMQPFIENAIIHAFEDGVENATIWISISRIKDSIIIKIRDNGKGMTAESVEQINRGEIEGKDRTHIGMVNVITRMKMYYGTEASVAAESNLGEGTTITLSVPYYDNTL